MKRGGIIAGIIAIVAGIVILIWPSFLYWIVGVLLIVWGIFRILGRA
ncbi:MAG: DUF3096 domain-containing protein [Dehalococcoidia bacterium]|nr:DUF3096 domain-containing protein [Dehalococcoidia bacterium]